MLEEGAIGLIDEGMTEKIIQKLEVLLRSEMSVNGRYNKFIGDILPKVYKWRRSDLEYLYFEIASRLYLETNLILSEDEYSEIIFNGTIGDNIKDIIDRLSSYIPIFGPIKDGVIIIGDINDIADCINCETECRMRVVYKYYKCWEEFNTETETITTKCGIMTIDQQSYDSERDNCKAACGC